MLVEDELSVLELGKKMLGEMGYQVLTAKPPSYALTLAREHSFEFHLLLTDIIMPEMNGFDLAERIKIHRPAVKTLFMSGYRNDAISHHHPSEEEFHFIQKPFSKDRLAAKIRETLDGRQ